MDFATLPPLDLSASLSRLLIWFAYTDLLVLVMIRAAARTYAPSLPLFAPPVSVNIIRPTRNLFTGIPLNTDTRAAFSLSKAVFQFAVLSTTINTFGVSAVVGGTPTNN